MKVTLVIDGAIMRRLKQEAARTGRTVSELVDAALRTMLDAPRKRARKLPPLPTFDGGTAYVDISDREALYQTMERR